MSKVLTVLSSSPACIHTQQATLVLHLACLSKVFQRSCFLSESGCKGKPFFLNRQIFPEVFSEKFFPVKAGDLSRSLAPCKVRYSDMPGIQPYRQDFNSVKPSALESGCKSRHFSRNGKKIGAFFPDFFHGMDETCWNTE